MQRTAQGVVDVLKVKTGHVKVYKIGNDLIQVPASIAFHKMDQEHFSEFYESCIKVVLSEFMPSMPRCGLAEKVNEMTSCNYGVTA